MELKVWHGDWGLPSIDHHCLAVMVSIDTVMIQLYGDRILWDTSALSVN